MQLFYGDVCNVSYKERMIMYLMGVLYKEMLVMDKIMMLSHLKP
jgi:hypothetical protein